jgi:hypothetical protein
VYSLFPYFDEKAKSLERPILHAKGVSFLTFLREWQPAVDYTMRRALPKRTRISFKIFSHRVQLYSAADRDRLAAAKAQWARTAAGPWMAKTCRFCMVELLKASLRLRRLYFHVDKFNGYF